MKIKHIWILVISLYSSLSFAQKKDSLQVKNPLPYSIFVGVDLAKPVMGLLDKNHQQYEASINARVYKKWHAALEIGYHKDVFDEIDWLIDVDGLYYKAGFNYDLSNYKENQNEAIYVGMRYARTDFNQEIKQYTIRFEDPALNQTGSFPKAKTSASWIEFGLGVRTKLFSLPLYADVNGHMKFLASNTKDNGVESLIIPGYGKSLDKIKFGLTWSLSYEIPYKKTYKSMKIQTEKEEIPLQEK